MNTLSFILSIQFIFLCNLNPTHSTTTIGQWTTASLSEARNNLAATSVSGENGNSIALFAGGYVSNYSAVVDIWYSSNNTWTTASLSEARSKLAATSVSGENGNSIALFAGGYVSNYSAVVDIWYSSNNTWTTASLSQARCYLAATFVNGVALFGGGYGSSAYSAVVDLYNTTGTQTINITSGIIISTTGSTTPTTTVNIVAIVIPIVIVFLLVIVAIVFFILRRYKISSTSQEGRELDQSTFGINDIKEVNIFERLGGGTFGDVYRGLWLGTDSCIKKT